ncbi:MAG: hypothetical protein JSS49_13685 [Planctomycetes bacterium]|nr:hypothetical protein [Planctomycetota bacterium]
MRLTLRTLLAYLDDVLEPAQTKLIGQKIQESAVAGKLVSLIRLVVRQRRLKAPSVSGPNMGIDPNVIAQYLDNTLAPDQVVEVEKVLLTSDELLAEVASCHQVLALVMGKSAEVSEASRERLYALGPVAAKDQLQVEEPRNVSSNNGTAVPERDVERTAETVSAKPEHVEIPEYLRQNSWSQKVVPAAIVAVLVLVCLGLLISDPGFLTGIQQAKSELGRDGKPTATDTIKPVDGADSAADSSTNPDVAGADSKMASTATDNVVVNVPSPTLVPGVDPAAPIDALDVNSRTKPPVDGPADAAAAVAVAANPPPLAVTPPANTVPVTKDPSPVLNPVPVQYTSNDGVVLRLDEAQLHWYMMPHRSAVAPGEFLVVLDPFDATFDMDRGAIILTVVGGSSLNVLPPDRVYATGLDVRRGRLMLRANRKDVSQCPVLAITIGGDLWRLEMLSPETTCTLEVAPREPAQFEKALGPNWYVGVVRVLSGSVKWTPLDGKAQTIVADTALEIVPQQGDPAVRPEPVSSASVPDWTDAQKRKQSPQRRFATQFEKQFELDQPVEQTLLALIQDPNAKIVELAVHGLSLTESFPAMIQALGQCSYEEGRFAARDGIRTWLAREEGRGKIMMEILEQRYPPSEASALYKLLWGFRPDDSTNRATALELIAWLRSSHVEVRELAYYWIVNLSNRKFEFRAADVPGRRETAIRKIEAHVASAGALVKPDKVAAPK